MRNRITAMLAGILLVTAFLTLGAPKAQAATITLDPVADSHVQADEPTANFGTSTSLRIDGSPVSRAYLKFDVQGLATGTAPTRATLKIVSPISSTTPINAKSVADTSWTESGLTFDNAPEVGSTLASATPGAPNSVLSFDVTSRVTGNGLVSFAVDTTSTTSKSLPSGENPTVGERPQLILETGALPSPTQTQPSGPSPTQTQSQAPSGSTVIAFAGDVACGTTEADYNGGAGTADKCRQKATSDLVLNDIKPSLVFAMGDLQYNSGSSADFNVSYQNSWGRFKSITKPVVGNHEYGTSGAGGYFSYFQNAATPRQPGCLKNCDGYYSFDVAVGAGSSWHIAVINSECSRIGGGVGCAVGSPQYEWLKADLAGNSATCTAVLTHKPRWSSSSFYTPDIQRLVELMEADKVDLLLAGHAHSYERFTPQKASGAASSSGIRAITVGTGGRDSQGFGTVLPNSLVRKNHIFGVQKLTLQPTGYSWSFVADRTTPFSESGSGNCV